MTAEQIRVIKQALPLHAYSHLGWYSPGKFPVLTRLLNARKGKLHTSDDTKLVIMTNKEALYKKL